MGFDIVCSAQCDMEIVARICNALVPNDIRCPTLHRHQANSRNRDCASFNPEPCDICADGIQRKHIITLSHVLVIIHHLNPLFAEPNFTPARIHRMAVRYFVALLQ